MSIQELNLKRPIVFFDIESTGTVPLRDRIVEISVIKLMPSGEKEVVTRRINPEMPIPPGASEIHHIYDADVANCPTFAVIAKNLLKYFEDCDLGGYNIIGFDIPILIEEFKRAGLTFSMEDRKVIDAFRIFCKLYPRTLSAAYEFFCDGNLEDAHSAEADTQATIDVFFGQLSKHKDLPRDIDLLHQFCDNRDSSFVDSNGRFKWSGSEVIVNFGKNSGRVLKEVAVNDPGFLKWILRSDFSDDVKKIAQNALIGKFPEWKNNEDKKD